MNYNVLIEEGAEQDLRQIIYMRNIYNSVCPYLGGNGQNGPNILLFCRYFQRSMDKNY